MLGDFSILTIPLLCTLKSLWVNHGVVPKNKWFHITGTLADSHTDHEQRFSPVATYLRVLDDGGSSWAGDKPKIPEAPEAKRKAPRRSAPSAKGRGDRKRPSAPAPETTDDVGDQARPGAELAAKKRLFCHVLHPQAGGSPGHPNEGSLELAPTGERPNKSDPVLQAFHGQNTAGPGAGDRGRFSSCASHLLSGNKP